MEEIWKDIEGFPTYSISNYCRVQHNGKFIRPIKNGSGYYIVNLYKDGKRHTIYLHRLLAKAFIPNPDNLPCVNHKDESRDNNILTNLEWCSYKHNSNWGTRNERISDTQKRKIVVQMDMDGNVIREWESASAIEKEWGIPCRGNIQGCCRNAYGCKSAYGFKWRYKE